MLLVVALKAKINRSIEGDQNPPQSPFVKGIVDLANPAMGSLFRSLCYPYQNPSRRGGCHAPGPSFRCCGVHR